MENSDRLRLAIDIAFIWHAGQKRLDGSDYIYHPLSVMMQLKDESYATQIVAVLHDIIEDTKFDMNELEENFGHEIAEAIRYLTKSEGQTYEQYIHNIKTSGCEIAIKVKRADLIHNLVTIDNIKDPAKKSMLKDRYYKAFKELS